MAGEIRETRERELKLGAPDADFTLPELGGVPLEPRSFTSTYHDTEALDLARAGATLRRRVENGLSLWQLKLPQGDARLELEAPGGPAGPPSELAALLTARLRGQTLEPVASLRTRRQGVRIESGRGALAEVVVDHVDVLEGVRVQSRFQEIEVELIGEGDERDLRRLERKLRRAGALPANGLPKVFGVLGLDGSGEHNAGKGNADRLRSLLARQRDELLAHDPGVRLGTDPEELHKFRVATRRLRALLRSAASFLPGEPTATVAGELRWLGTSLGAVRDLDVLIDHLGAEAQCLEEPDREAAAGVLSHLEEAREDARAEMLVALGSSRYVRLLDTLDELVEAPWESPRAAALRRLAAREATKLRRAAESISETTGDDELHRLRIKAKRARYAAELAEPLAGPRASSFVALAKKLQDVIGSHQDAVVAEERLRGLAADLDGPGALAAGRLIERERRRRREARSEFPRLWPRVEKAGRRAFG